MWYMKIKSRFIQNYRQWLMEQKTRVPVVLNDTGVVLHAVHGNLKFENLKDDM